MLRSNTHERNLRLRDVLEREGIGPSKWRQRDCITLVRAVIRELSGQEPKFTLPAWAEDLSEKETLRQAPRHYGTLRQGWIDLLEGEPLLHRLPEGVLPSPGMIALTPVRDFEVEGAASVRGPWVGVIAPTCELLVRTPNGLASAWPIADLWEIRRD